MRNALIVEVQPDQLGNLSFLAGMLVGLGRPEAEVLKQILDSLQMVEVDDDFGVETPETPETDGEVVDLFGADAGGSPERLEYDDSEAAEQFPFTPQDYPDMTDEAASADEARARNTTPSGFPMDIGAGPTPDSFH